MPLENQRLERKNAGRLVTNGRELTRAAKSYCLACFECMGHAHNFCVGLCSNREDGEHPQNR